MRTHLLTGQTLIDHVKKENLKCTAKSTMCLSAGYYRVTSKGSILPGFTRFYESLLDAKGIRTTEKLEDRLSPLKAPVNIGVYIACLASYNCGILHGSWIDLEEIEDIEHLQECIDDILLHSSQPDAEEWAMHDHQGLPDFMGRDENPALEDLLKLADIFINECSTTDEYDIYKIWSEYNSELIDYDDFVDAFQGDFSESFSPGSDFAEQLYDQCEYISDDNPLKHYVDYERVWHDLSCDGYIEIEGYIFHPF